MSLYTDHRGIRKQLKAVQDRAKKGIHTHDDYHTLVSTIIKLTDMVYKPLIEKEEQTNERRD
jgi:hypothetical protein